MNVWSADSGGPDSLFTHSLSHTVTHTNFHTLLYTLAHIYTLLLLHTHAHSHSLEKGNLNSEVLCKMAEMTFHYVGIPQHWSSCYQSLCERTKPHNPLKLSNWHVEKLGKKWSSLENLHRECPAFVRSRTFLISVADFIFCCVLWEIFLVLCGSPGLGLCMNLVVGKESEDSFSGFDLICILSPFLIRWYLLIHQKWMKNHVTPWNRFVGVFFHIVLFLLYYALS